MTIRHKGRVISGNYQAGGTLDNFYATTDLDNLSDKGNEKINSKLPSKDFYNKITNCITELPQRIKYTLEDGVLTMKAGSVFIIPNGPRNLQWPLHHVTPPSEDFITIYNQYEGDKYFVWAQSLKDITLVVDTTKSGNFLVFASLYPQLDLIPPESVTSSNANIGVVNNSCHYNTTTNYIVYAYNGTWHTQYQGFPIMSVTCKNGLVTSINQVFNGRGCMGNIIWCDRGVKGLRPSGKNTNGTLNSIEFTTNKLIWTDEVTTDGSLRTVFFNESQIYPRTYVNCFNQTNAPEKLPHTDNSGYWYNPETNCAYTCVATTGEPVWTLAHAIELGRYKTSSNGVEDVVFHNPPSLLTNVQKGEISSWSMPSDKYIDLTLGASGTTYTAPANGWVIIAKVAGADRQYLGGVVNDVIVFNIVGWNRMETAYEFPVKKGDVYRFSYSYSGATNKFRFIYAEGEV